MAATGVLRRDRTRLIGLLGAFWRANYLGIDTADAGDVLAYPKVLAVRGAGLGFVGADYG